jgi:hypothetical protein
VLAKDPYPAGDLSMVIIDIVAAIVILGLGLFFFLANGSYSSSFRRRAHRKEFRRRRLKILARPDSTNFDEFTGCFTLLP